MKFRKRGKQTQGKEGNKLLKKRKNALDIKGNKPQEQRQTNFRKRGE